MSPPDSNQASGLLCSRYQQDWDLLALGALDPDVEQEMAIHLRLCEECRQSFIESEAVAEAISTVTPDDVVPLAERLVEGDKRLAGPRAFRLPDPPRYLSWALVAACVVSLLLVGHERDGLLDELGQTRMQVSEYRSMLGPLCARSVQQVELKSVHPDVNRATVRAMWSRDAGVLLMAGNLPPAKAGQCYRVWVLRNGGAPAVSAGVLNVQAGGTGALYLPPGESLAGAAGFAITDSRERHLLVGLRTESH